MRQTDQRHPVVTDVLADAPDPTVVATPPRALAAVLASAIVHAAIAAAMITMGVSAARAIRHDPAPILVAEWTPPPPAGTAPAPPELPIPGGAPVHAGPATRGRTDDATAAALGAERMARLVPTATAPLRAPAPRMAGALGFDAAVPAAWRAESFAQEAARTAFVIDASGRLLSALPAARAVLAQRLGALTPQQEFMLVVARGSGIEVAPGTPTRATHDATAAALRWFTDHAAPGGTADLGAGLQRAWTEMKPDAVCILARGVTTVRRSAARSSTAGLAAAADRLNPADASNKRAAAFLCIELGEAGTDGVLRAVGARHGGPQGYLLMDRAGVGAAPAAPAARTGPAASATVTPAPASSAPAAAAPAAAAPVTNRPSDTSKPRTTP